MSDLARSKKSYHTRSRRSRLILHFCGPKQSRSHPYLRHLLHPGLSGEFTNARSGLLSKSCQDFVRKGWLG